MYPRPRSDARSSAGEQKRTPFARKRSPRPTDLLASVPSVSGRSVCGSERPALRSCISMDSLGGDSAGGKTKASRFRSRDVRSDSEVDVQRGRGYPPKHRAALPHRSRALHRALAATNKLGMSAPRAMTRWLASEAWKISAISQQCWMGMLWATETMLCPGSSRASRMWC